MSRKRKNTTKQSVKSFLTSNLKQQRNVEDKSEDDCNKVGLQHHEISERECVHALFSGDWWATTQWQEVLIQKSLKGQTVSIEAILSSTFHKM